MFRSCDLLACANQTVNICHLRLECETSVRIRVADVVVFVFVRVVNIRTGQEKKTGSNTWNGSDNLPFFLFCVRKAKTITRNNSV